MVKMTLIAEENRGLKLKFLFEAPSHFKSKAPKGVPFFIFKF